MAASRRRAVSPLLGLGRFVTADSADFTTRTTMPRRSRERQTLAAHHGRKEIIPLVVHDDERRKTRDLDLPDRFHSEAGILEHVHFLDAVTSEPRRGSA